MDESYRPVASLGETEGRGGGLLLRRSNRHAVELEAGLWLERASTLREGELKKNVTDKESCGAS
jgi:hypothetical protein